MRIRPPHAGDLTDLHETATQPGVVWGTTTLPSSTEARVHFYLNTDPEKVCKLVAEVDGRAVGSIDLWVGEGVRRHSAALGMSVHDRYQGRGIGTALMQAILDIADNHLMLERVALEVYPDNEPARRLYAGMGFTEEGRRRQAVRRDGRYADLVCMSRLRGRALQPAAAGAPTTGATHAGATAGTPTASAPPPTPPAAVIPPAPVTIRPVRSGDVTALHAIRLQPPVAGQLGIPASYMEEQVRKELAGLTPQDHLLIAEVEGEVAGYGHLRQYTGRRGHAGGIHQLAVDPRHQGRGVGTRLLQALVEVGERWLGLRRIEAELFPDNRPALQMLERCGFAAEARLRAAQVRDGQLADLVVMARLAAGE